MLPSPPLSPSPVRRERGIMECGSEASAHAEANASALQTGQRAAPLSHAVGEGLGVRAESGRTLHTVNPSDVPFSGADRVSYCQNGMLNKRTTDYQMHAHTLNYAPTRSRPRGENRPCLSDSVPNRCTLIRSARVVLSWATHMVYSPATERDHGWIRP